MRKVLAGAIPLIAMLVFAASSQATVHSPAGVCARMVSQDNNGDIGQSANGGYSPPWDQAVFIATSQGQSGFSGTYTVDQSTSTYTRCTSRYTYDDAFGVDRLIKIYSQTFSHYNGLDDIFDYWNFEGRGCYYKGSSGAWIAWNCA